MSEVRLNFPTRNYMASSVTNVVPQTPSWTSPLSGPAIFWFDADNAGSITQAGGFVSAWADLSGNARHLNNVLLTNGLGYNASVQNSKPGLLGENSSSCGGLYTTSTFTQAQPFTLYIAFKTFTSIADFADIFDGHNGASGDRTILFGKRSDVANDPAVYAGSNVSAGSDLVVSTAYYYTVVLDGASSAIWRNGVSIGTVNPGTAGITNGIALGNASNPPDCYYLECFAEANAGTNRTSAEAYLAAKWAI